MGWIIGRYRWDGCGGRSACDCDHLDAIERHHRAGDGLCRLAEVAARSQRLPSSFVVPMVDGECDLVHHAMELLVAGDQVAILRRVANARGVLRNKPFSDGTF